MGEETLWAERLEVGCSGGGESLGAPGGCWGRGTVLPCGCRLQQGREGGVWAVIQARGGVTRREVAGCCGAGGGSCTQVVLILSEPEKGVEMHRVCGEGPGRKLKSGVLEVRGLLNLEREGRQRWAWETFCSGVPGPGASECLLPGLTQPLCLGTWLSSVVLALHSQVVGAENPRLHSPP